jgi:ABC-type siderophore export system fused ATPase/permease subunit
MARIPRRYNQYMFGVIQSWITCALVAAVSCAPVLSDASFVVAWLKSWLTSWAAILPVVLLAAPVIRRIVDKLTCD